MDGFTYVTHTQTIYLRADESPPFPQRVRHWIVSSTTGILPAHDLRDNAEYIAALPDRIVTVPMLHRLFRQHIMTALLLVWIYAMCWRLLQPRYGIAGLHKHDSICLVLPVLCFGYADWLKVSIILRTRTSLLYGTFSVFRRTMFGVRLW